MSRVRLVPYNITSKSGRALARGLHLLRCNIRNTRFRPRNNDIIINWGCSSLPYSGRYQVINSTEAVRNASNKIKTFQLLEELAVENTKDFSIAKNWIENGDFVYQRNLVASHGGNGIKVVHSVEELEYAPLYTKGVHVDREYRVHVVNGQVIDYIRKSISRDNRNVNQYIRNHTQGWIFTRGGFEQNEEIKNIAIKAIQKLNLDFGAVDVIQEKETNKVYVLEVNTAPGIMGTSLQEYINAFERNYL